MRIEDYVEGCRDQKKSTAKICGASAGRDRGWSSF